VVANAAAHRTAASAFASETGEDADADPTRVRLSAARVDELVRTLSSTYGFDVTREQVRALVGETRERHAYTVSNSSSGSDADEAVTRDSEALSQTESDKELGPGAFFPAWTPRVGRCEYAPLFWALEAVCGDGFDEARLAVELIARALGGDVDAPQGTNHHSHVTGSLAAMATAAAIHAAAPLSVPALAESVSSSAMRRGAKSEEDEGAEVEAPDDGFFSAVPETDARDDAAAVSTTELSKATSPSPSPTRAYAALAAAAAEANAKADLCDARKATLSQTSKLPPPAERSRFRSRFRGVLGASRFEKATRLAAREKAREAAAAKMAADEAEAFARREDARARAWRGVGVRTKEGYEDTRVAGGKANANGAERVAAAADSEEDAPPGTLDAESEALHRDLDEIKKRNTPSVAGDDVAGDDVASSPAPPPGLMGALAALLGLDESTPADTGDAGAAAAEESARAARETRARMARDRAARLAAVHKTATFFLRATKRIDAVCVNPLLMELGAASLAPFEYTPLFCALHGAATARGAEQMAVANELATLCLDRGANVSAPGAHATVGGVLGDASSSSLAEKESSRTRHDSALRSYPLMWAVAAALRGDSPHARVDDALALTKRVLMAGADPAAVNFAVAVKRFTASPERNDDDVDAGIYASKVLHLWDERALLLEVFDQTEWQRVVTLRLKLCRLLGEAGARASFRADSGMRSVAKRAAPFVESSYPREWEDESSSLERLKWAEGVRRTRQLLEHGGVPSQYAVWVWPTTEREAFPPGDRLGDARRRRQTKNARNASFERKDGDAVGGRAESNSASEFEYAEAHRAPRPFGAPARACEIEVMPRRADLRRPGVRGVVDVSRVRSEDVFEDVSFFGAGKGDEEREDVSAAAVRSRALASRLLWESRADGVSERADAARRASVLAIRELLAGEPEEPPASSDSSDSEPEPFATASESSDASEYESRFAFVPKAPRRARLPAGQKKKSRGVVHAALVFMGFRKKKLREKKKAEEEDDDARRTTTTTTTTRASDASKPPSRISASKDRVRVTLASAREEALGTVAEALMRNPNSRQADRFHGVPSLAAMAKAETSRRETSRLSNTFEHGVRTELGEASADPPPPAFGALGRYMRAVEREEAPDWNAATRRPMRRLLT